MLQKLLRSAIAMMLRQADLYCDAATASGLGTCAANKRSSARAAEAANLPDFPPLPIIAPDQTHICGVSGSDLLEIPLRKLGHKPMGAVSKIKQSLSLGHRGSRTC